LLEHNAGKFKLNKKELDYILQQLINKNTTTTKNYNTAIENLLDFLVLDRDDVQYERLLYIFKFCMKNRKFSFEFNTLLYPSDKKLVKYFIETIVDKELTDQNRYDKIFYEIYEYIKDDFYDYQDETEAKVLKILEYLGKHRKFNLRHFKLLSSGFLHSFDEYKGIVNITVFIKKLFEQKYIDQTASKENIKEIHKYMLKVYHEIFNLILFAIYKRDDKNLKIELKIRDETKEAKALIRNLIKRTNEIMNKFDSDDFQDREVKKALLLEINTMDSSYNRTSSNDSDGMSPPGTYKTKIILGDADTLTILQKHHVHDNVQYVVDDFEIDD
jgi:hypothetical protein